MGSVAVCHCYDGHGGLCLCMLSDREIRELLGPLPEGGDEPVSQKAGPRKNVKQWIVGVLAAVGVVLWGAGIALIFHFEKSAPHQPNAQTGQIQRFNDPFSVVYLTAQQHLLVDAVVIVLPVLTIAMVVVAVMTLGRKPAVEG